jgi:protein tyrosine/serine phosphatase
MNGILYRSSRPGYPEKAVGEAVVLSWISQAKAKGIRTILCMLDDEQLSFYSAVHGGLIEYYRKAGFNVVHRPVKDHLKPAVPEDTIVRIYADFLFAAKPILVHCSAGCDRTGAVVDFLKNKSAISF